MSVRTLSRKLNALTGMSPAKVIRLYRLSGPCNCCRRATAYRRLPTRSL
jgi:AraC-like DNA-binding protein